MDEAESSEEIISISSSEENFCDEVSENYLSNIFKCPICFHTMENPRFLVCGHGFCMDCIGEFFLFEKERSTEPTKCPVCRDDTSVKFTRVPAMEECLNSIRGFIKRNRMKQLEYGEKIRFKYGEKLREYRKTISKQEDKLNAHRRTISKLEDKLNAHRFVTQELEERIEMLESHIKNGASILEQNKRKKNFTESD